MSLTDLTLTDALAKLRAGEITATALTEAHLARIQAHDGLIHSYLTVTAEQALAAAHAADQRRAQGEDLPLLGIPVAIKDILCTEGVETTAGSKILKGFKPPYTATSVQKLFNAGAIMLGKTNTDEFAMGSSTENSAYGPTRNPWKTDRIPGGSSGGSAAAIAAGFAMGALGTDTGGSVRQPASMCGIVGIKPSYGRVSRWGAIAFASSLDQVGAFGRTVKDAAIMLQVIAGHDPLDSTSMRTPVPNYLDALTGDVKGLRVGVPKEYFIDGMEKSVVEGVRAAIHQLEKLGAEIHEISLPNTDHSLSVYYLVAPAEAAANLARYDGVRFGPRIKEKGMWPTYKATRGQGFGPEVKRRIMLGTYALSAGYYDAYYAKAQKVRTLIKQDFEEAFKSVDVIACPTAPRAAFRIGEKVDDPLQMYLEDVFTLPTSLAGVCGLSVPCALDGEELPIGLQLIGPAFGEGAILRAAYAYEQSNTLAGRVAPL